MRMSTKLALAPLAVAAALTAVSAQAQVGKVATPALWEAPSGPEATTGNTSAPSNWRLNPAATFNGVANAFNGTALLLFTTTEASGTYACSGSLVASQWLLTAAHCADGLISMSVNFGYYAGSALQSRTAIAAIQHPGWDGSLDTGADVALIKLSAPVTGLNIYSLSTTNDIGKTQLITGYGTSGTGSSGGSPSWADQNYGHYGYNVADTSSATLGAAWDAYSGEGVYVDPTYGVTYVSDFDYYNANSTAVQRAQYNTLNRIKLLTGASWTSGEVLGTQEALIAGGDSGGGDFIWDAANNKWVLSAVHSWGWQFCQGRIESPSCDYRTGNSSSYGDLSGSTAVFSHVQWINSVIAVPEPATYLLMAMGLFAVGAAARRRA